MHQNRRDVCPQQAPGEHRRSACLFHVHLYTPWYVRGTLSTSGENLSMSERCAVLLGAWNGLAWLHAHNILHYGQEVSRLLLAVTSNLHSDVRADEHGRRSSNILIGNGTPLTGVLGDIDDVMFTAHCNPNGADIISTPGYGAPFMHCGRDGTVARGSSRDR